MSAPPDAAMLARECDAGVAPARAAAMRIATLTGGDPTITSLARQIRSGVVRHDDPALIDHLRRNMLPRLAIEQPQYVHQLAHPDTTAPAGPERDYA